jgi:hypothetical protein
MLDYRYVSGTALLLLVVGGGCSPAKQAEAPKPMCVVSPVPYQRMVVRHSEFKTCDVITDVTYMGSSPCSGLMENYPGELCFKFRDPLEGGGDAIMGGGMSQSATAVMKRTLADSVNLDAQKVGTRFQIRASVRPSELMPGQIYYIVVSDIKPVSDQPPMQPPAAVPPPAAPYAPATAPAPAPAQVQPPAAEPPAAKADAASAKPGAAAKAPKAAAKTGGCTKDSECKGARVCVNGACTDAK